MSNFHHLVRQISNGTTCFTGDSAQKLHYWDHAGAVGGIYEFAAPSFRKKWWGSISLNDPRVEEIDCGPLDSLLKDHAPNTTFFDFFSLDVEGAELSALRSIDFDRVGFGVIFAEADKHSDAKNTAVRTLLERNGYIYLEDYQRSQWFINRWFDEIYKGLIY